MHDVRGELQMLVELNIPLWACPEYECVPDQIFPCELQGELRSGLAEASIVLRCLPVHLLVTKV